MPAGQAAFAVRLRILFGYLLGKLYLRHRLGDIGVERALRKLQLQLQVRLAELERLDV